MPNESDAVPNPVRNIGKVQKFAVGTDFEAYAEQSNPVDLLSKSRSSKKPKPKKEATP